MDRGGMDQGDRPRPPGEERRPPQNPAMERWHRVQTQKLMGLLAICAGTILALLGLVRISFSRMERQYTTETGNLPRSQ
jgi:ferric-dicitrate binding protein FerR (iron transport regulator)